MHTLWSIAELRRHFAEVVRNELSRPFGSAEGTVDDGEYTNSTLVSLACVLRDFMDPALAFIWRELPSICPILQLMPSATPPDVHNLVPSIFRDNVR
jgi:hypothetical protein